MYTLIATFKDGDIERTEYDSEQEAIEMGWQAYRMGAVTVTVEVRG